MLGMLFADGLSEFGPAIDKLIDLHDPSEDTSADDRFAFALLSELRGRFNSRGLRELGLDLHAPHAIFGLGIYPAFRIELGDGVKFNAWIDRALAAAGLANYPMKLEAGSRIWEVRFDELPDGWVGLVGVSNSAFSFAAVPKPEVGVAVDVLVGRSPSDQTLTADRLAGLAAKAKFDPGVIGFVDSPLLVASLVGDASKSTSLSSPFVKASPFKGAGSPECVTQYLALASRVPLAVMGLQSADKDTTTVVSVISVDEALMSAIRDEISPMPAVVRHPAKAALGLGMRLGGALRLLGGLATAARSLSTCHPVFAEFGEELGLEEVDPMLEGVHGLGVVVDEFSFDEQAKIRVRGMAVARVSGLSGAQELTGFLGLVFPNLNGVTVSGSGPPRRLQTPSPETLDLGPIFFHGNKTAIGCSAGPTTGDELVDFLSSTSDRSDALLYTRNFSGMLSGSGPDNDDELPTEVLELMQRAVILMNSKKQETWLLTRAGGLEFRTTWHHGPTQ